ncbi:MAG: Alcohol acetyltransferase [Firmicutes bacterium ADurb.Bin182]|nr:MAG: Alcohol acetyltransferase [Firmicutes bacterium ADurb.Bin182]
MKSKRWYKLDNAAKIYPAITTSKWTPIFRFTAVLKRPVDAGVLKAALDKTMVRFPLFNTCLKTGFFWYYLEDLGRPVVPEPDVVNPCAPMNRGDPLLRVRYHENRISVEAHHGLTDGSGLMTFLKTLLSQYFRQQGFDVPATHGVLDVNEPPDPSEEEDSFLKYSRMSALPSRRETRAYHPSGTPIPPGDLIITTGTMSASEIHKKAHEARVSVTEYLTAVLLQSIYTLQKAEQPKKQYPVKISVPVNLRKFYRTNTLRNFSQYVNPGIDPNYGEFTFEEILSQLHHQFRFMLTEKNLNARMSKNVNDELSVAIRAMPLFIKKPVMILTHMQVGERIFSSPLSNMGFVELPDVIRDEVERFDMVLHTARYNKLECSAASYNDTLSVSFSRSIAQPHTERLFFTALVRQGIRVKVESNI